MIEQLVRDRLEALPSAFSLVAGLAELSLLTDAPAVTPMRVRPCSHDGSSSSADPIRRASHPIFSATSRRRLLFELVGEPITSTRSHCGAMNFTASCRFWVA